MRVRSRQGADGPRAPRARRARSATACDRIAGSRSLLRSRPQGERSLHDDSNHCRAKSRFVTGASRGIGHAIALALGAAGATVIGTATGATGVAAIDEALKSAGVSGARHCARRRRRRRVRSGDRRHRRPRRCGHDPRQQRGHHARHAAAAHEAGGLGCRHRDQSRLGLPPEQGRAARHDEGAQGPHHQHRFGGRADRQSRARPITAPRRRASAVSRARWRGRWRRGASRSMSSRPGSSTRT